MRILVLGKGKTGSVVAHIASERGHGVCVLGTAENEHASALTAPNLAGMDVVIDFTAPDAAIENTRAVLALGGRIVVGITGWYARLDEMKALAVKRGGALLYGTNFSIGVKKLFRLTAELANLDGYTFSIVETHHESKRDAHSGTAITLRQIIEAAQSGADVEITSHRLGDAKGEHVIIAVGPDDSLQLKHDVRSRHCLAFGAVRAAEWLAGKSGAWEFREIFDQL